MSESYKKRDSEEVFEEQTLVRDSNGARIVAKGKFNFFFNLQVFN